MLSRLVRRDIHISEDIKRRKRNFFPSLSFHEFSYCCVLWYVCVVYAMDMAARICNYAS